MKALELPVPHGFLIWRGKQRLIGHKDILPVDEKMVLVSGGEAYGEIVLDLASKMTSTEFDRLEDDHCIRPEERRLWWNGNDQFFVYNLSFEPYHKMKACRIEGDEAVLIEELAVDEKCLAILEKVGRLPKIVVLRENVIALDGVKVLKQVDTTIEPMLDATLEDFDLGDKALPIYHLALVKIPNLRFQDSKQEESMPYKKVERDGKWCVIKTTDDSVEKCYDNEGEADDFLTALNLNVEDKKKDGNEIEDEKAGRRMASRMMDRLKEAWQTMRDLLTWAEYDDDEMKAVGIKEIQGKYWFFAHSTNAFQDREAEIFSTKSLEQYVSESEKQADKGYFNFWHIPGSDFAKKEWQGVVGRVLVEAGPFLDNDFGQKALEFFKQYPGGHPDIAPEGWGCSPEYRYLPEERKSGIYQNVWITRTSALPRLAAANIWTKGGIMALTDQQLKAAQAVFGEELASQIIANAERQTKELEEAGIAHKSNEEPTESKLEEVKTPEPVEPVETEVKAEDTGKQEEPVTEEESEEEKPESKPDFGEMIAKSLQPMMEGMAMMAGRMDEMMGRLSALEGSEKMKNATETPRWLVDSMTRASQSQKTTVTEDDPLNSKKPVETAAPAKRGADAFFSPR